MSPVPERHWEATNTQQADTVAVMMTITKATRTMAFRADRLRLDAPNVKAHGEASAQVNDSIKRGETQNITVRITGRRWWGPSPAQPAPPVP